MDIRQLRYFISVAEEGNFSRAAERLHISQPPLSQQIKALEESLRVTLFVRGRHGARLTRAGEALLVRARSIVSDCDSVEKFVRRVADGLEVEVSFATHGDLGGHLKLVRGGHVICDRPLATRVEDDYGKWSTDSRFQAWMTDPHMRAVIGESEGRTPAPQPQP